MTIVYTSDGYGHLLFKFVPEGVVVVTGTNAHIEDNNISAQTQGVNINSELSTENIHAHIIELFAQAQLEDIEYVAHFNGEELMDLVVAAGEGLSIIFTVRESKNPSSAIVDLSTATSAHFTAVDIEHGTGLNIIKSGAGQFEITDAVNGQITLTLTKADTENEQANDYVFDAWVVFPTGPRRISTGVFTIERRYTTLP